jgi:hypothetical protein
MGRRVGNPIAVPQGIIAPEFRSGDDLCSPRQLHNIQRRSIQSNAGPSSTASPPMSCRDAPAGHRGAGSGKTNTLAHRVERIARKVLGVDAGITTDAPSWAGISV